VTPKYDDDDDDDNDDIGDINISFLYCSARTRLVLSQMDILDAFVIKSKQSKDV